MQQALDIITGLDPDKNILLVDADEVLLKFACALEVYLPTVGYEFKVESFALTGNVYSLKTGEAASAKTVKSLLDQFFTDYVEKIPVVAGAADGLAALSVHYQIIILSNVPSHCKERRQKHLASLNMDYPVIANKGEKGPVVKLFSGQCRGKTIFIDDLPPHHASVANHCNKTVLIHYVADKRLAGFIPKAPAAHHRFENWAEITNFLTDLAQNTASMENASLAQSSGA